MKILHVIDHWGLGGAQRALSSLIRGDHQNHHEVAALFTHGCVDWSLPKPPHFLAQSYAGTPLLPFRLRNLLRALEPDLIQVHLNGSRMMVGLAAAGLDIPVIWHEHSGVELLHIYGAGMGAMIAAVQRRQAVRVAGVIANSEDTAVWCRETLRVPDDRLRVLYCPLDRDEICAAALERVENPPVGSNLNGRVVGFVGRLAPQKGPLDFLRAVQPLLEAQPDLQAWVVGDGPLLQEMVDFVSPGLAERVLFWGYRSDVYAVMNHMDVVLMPSLYEPWGLVAVEALLLGKPVVAYDVGGPAEILAAAKQETLAAVGDTHGLTGLTRGLLEKGVVVSVDDTFSGIHEAWMRFYDELSAQGDL